MARNPPWTRDELILALDLYFKVNPLHTSENHPEIKSLSVLLNKLPAQGHAADAKLYRNPNGVYMKLCNYLRLDPSYKGKGLSRGGRLEETIWSEFSGDLERLERTALAIKKGATEIQPGDPDVGIVQSEDEEFTEGRILTTLHKRRERNPQVVRKKKAAVLIEHGRLECEICRFDFAVKYGQLGVGFTECHHIVPVSKLSAGQKTKIADLAIVCANCHRIIHRSRPMLTVHELHNHVNPIEAPYVDS
jgi:5-methylcytosine-specific restriction protein A